MPRPLEGGKRGWGGGEGGKGLCTCLDKTKKSTMKKHFGDLLDGLVGQTRDCFTYLVTPLHCTSTSGERPSPTTKYCTAAWTTPTCTPAPLHTQGATHPSGTSTRSSHDALCACLARACGPPIAHLASPGPSPLQVHDVVPCGRPITCHPPHNPTHPTHTRTHRRPK